MAGGEANRKRGIALLDQVIASLTLVIANLAARAGVEGAIDTAAAKKGK